MKKYEKSLKEYQAQQSLNPPATRDTLLGPVALIPINENHVDFIFNSWLKSYKNSATVKYVDHNIYYTEQHKVIQRLVKDAKTVVAVLPDDPSIIAGYLVYENIEGVFTVHFAYVKHMYRQCGVLKALLAHAGHGDTAGFYTHDTKPCASMCTKLKLIYHPYILSNYRGANGN